MVFGSFSLDKYQDEYSKFADAVSTQRGHSSLNTAEITATVPDDTDKHQKHWYCP